MVFDRGGVVVSADGQSGAHLNRGSLYPYRMAPLPISRHDRAAGILMVLGGGIHGALTPDHFGKWWGYGLFFLTAAIAQLVLGIALLTNAVNERDFGAGWLRMRAGMYAAGAVGNAMLIGTYVVSRTTGVPWFGPEAGEVERVGAIDVVTKLVEVVAIGFFVALWRSTRSVERGRATQAAR